MNPTLDTRKPIDQLTIEDLAAFPIWEFAIDEEGEDGQDETWVRPVDAAAVPADAYSLSVAADFTTSAGQPLIGFIGVTTAGHVELGPPILLARGRYLYCHSHGWLAAQLELTEAELFPLCYTLRVVVDGEAERRSGTFD